MNSWKCSPATVWNQTKSDRIMKGEFRSSRKCAQITLNTISVTRLIDCWKFLVANCLIKVAQIDGYFKINIENCQLLRKTSVATFEKYGQLLILTSGHIDYTMLPSVGQLILVWNTLSIIFSWQLNRVHEKMKFDEGSVASTYLPT